MLFPVFLRKVTKYEANGKKRMHQLSFPCRHLTLAPTHPHSRIRATTLTHPRHHSRASTPTPLRTYDTTRTQPRHHSRASTPTPLRTSDATLTHLRPPSIHISAPHYATSSSIYTHWCPPLRTFVLPSLFRSLSESIRIYPSLSDILREISMGPD